MNTHTLIDILKFTYLFFLPHCVERQREKKKEKERESIDSSEIVYDPTLERKPLKKRNSALKRF
jgi:hypothetical protein